MTCIFCDIICGAEKSHLLYEDEYHIAILDTHPITRGHSLVIPKTHHELITDMKPENVGRIFTIVPRLAKAVLQATNADAFNLGQNNGSAAQQVVPHVHIHIIPRYEGETPEWKERMQAHDSELADLAEKIKECLV